MSKVDIRVLGISGTPIKDGNCDKLVKVALEAAEEVSNPVVGRVETEFVTLADKNIVMCKHCQWCIENRKPCSKIEDDVHMVYDMIKRADGVILGGPVWAETLSPPLLILFSRSRALSFFAQEFRNKVVGFVTLSWFGTGVGPTFAAMDSITYVHQMIPVRKGWATVSTAAFGQRAAYMEHGVLDDQAGVERVKAVGKRVAEVARMIKFATQAGVITPEAPTYTGASLIPRKKRLVERVWRDSE